MSGWSSDEEDAFEKLDQQVGDDGEEDDDGDVL